MTRSPSALPVEVHASQLGGASDPAAIGVAVELDGLLDQAILARSPSNDESAKHESNRCPTRPRLVSQWGSETVGGHRVDQEVRGGGCRRRLVSMTGDRGVEAADRIGSKATDRADAEKLHG